MASSSNEHTRYILRQVARVLEVHCTSIGIDTASPDGQALAEILVAAIRDSPMSEIELSVFLHRLSSHVDVPTLTSH